MAVGAGDALFGQDGTGGDVVGPLAFDGVGPLAFDGVDPAAFDGAGPPASGRLGPAAFDRAGPPASGRLGPAASDESGPFAFDMTGPLPAFELPVVRLPLIGADGIVDGLEELDDGDPGRTAAPSAGPARLVAGDVRPSADETLIDVWEPRTVPGTAARSDSPIFASRAPAPDPQPRSSVPPSIPPATRATHAPAPRSSVPPSIPPATRATHAPAPRPPAQPRFEAEPSILGLTRRSLGRAGSRVFALVFFAVFAVILVQLVMVLLAS